MNKLPRLQLMELGNQSWVPRIFRQGINDYFQFVSNRGNMSEKIIPVMKKGLEKSPINRIVDICSNGNSGLQNVNKYFQNNGIKAEILLTNHTPDLDAFRQTSKSSKGNIRFISEPVDAANVPEDLTGFRTQFVSFHQFKPSHAQSILADAQEKQMPIGIFEVTQRNWMNFFSMFFTPLRVMFFTPFMGTLSFGKMFWTYIIPVIPICAMWDGIVSVCKTYNEIELKQMTVLMNKNNYSWETGNIKTGKGIQVFYLLGYPERVAMPDYMAQAA